MYIYITQLLPVYTSYVAFEVYMHTVYFAWIM